MTGCAAVVHVFLQMLTTVTQGAPSTGGLRAVSRAGTKDGGG
jgi:hypothetical protein